MASSTWPVYSPFAREHFSRGEAKGQAEGEANALLRVLSARGIEVPEDVHARIRACTDMGQLNTWLDRAAAATSLTDLFD